VPRACLRGPDKEGIIAVSESQRLALHAAARATLGEKEGDTLMALTPPANTDLATTQHLDRVEERLLARIETSALRTRLWTFGAIVAAQVASLTYLTNTLS
jgi:hypothetical protein